MAYIQSHKDQTWLLPPSIEDLIPEDHICYLVESLVEGMNYRRFDERYAGEGHPAYHPRVLLKILVMGVIDRVRSSRQLSRKARENIVYMYLSEKLTPDFRTISDFRKNNPDLVKEAFKHTVTLAREEGMLDLSHVATDGSKVKANASNKKVYSKEELEVLMKFVETELEEWAKQDEAEDQVYGQLRGSDQLPKQSKKRVQKAAAHYMKKVKEKGDKCKEGIRESLKKAREEAEDKEMKSVSITDPESRFMKQSTGKIELSYNAQITVDKKGIILANDVSKDGNDAGQLRPQVMQAEANTEMEIGKIKWSFDGGYFEGGNLHYLEGKTIDAYIPDQDKKRENPYDKRNFQYDETKDEYICPAKQRLTFHEKYFDKKKGKTIRVYKGQGCNKCEEQKQCTKSKTGIRYLRAYPYEKQRMAMADKMLTAEAKEIYKLRGQTVEPAFGDIKENKGVRGFLTRSLKTVKTEFNIACIARNLKIIWRCMRENADSQLLYYQA